MACSSRRRFVAHFNRAEHTAIHPYAFGIAVRAVLKVKSLGSCVLQPRVITDVTDQHFNIHPGGGDKASRIRRSGNGTCTLIADLGRRSNEEELISLWSCDGQKNNRCRIPICSRKMHRFLFFVGNETKCVPLRIPISCIKFQCGRFYYVRSFSFNGYGGFK